MRKRTTYALLVPAAAAVCALAMGAGDPPVADGFDPGLDQATPTPEQLAKMAQQKKAASAKRPEFPKFDDAAKDYKKVVSTADGARSLYTLWTRDKDAQMLAELPRNFGSQKLFIAYTIAGGTATAGVQMGDMYAVWKRFDKRLALVEPNFTVRTTGDMESKKGRERVFTDRVILDVPIVTMGPGGGPVVDMDALLVGQSTNFFGYATRGAKPQLAKIEKAKAFPKNIEVAYTLPLAGGRFGTLHYSFSALPEKTGYKPRKSDDRIGYFTTTHRDIGHPGADTPWVRYVNRWKLEKADPKLKMSPPKEPIVFYLEHTTPVRYRRWIRDGVLEWNKAFEEVGIVNAVEVYQQDARTGAHMEKDPEDARFNFVLWTNANMGFAIGPSRVDPRTGQILDADIVMDEGFITSWVNAWRKIIPETAMQNFGPEVLSWLEANPRWDPRVRLAAPAERQQVIHRIAMNRFDPAHASAGHPAAMADPTLIGDDRYDGLIGRVSQVNGYCEDGHLAALELGLLRLDPGLLVEISRPRGAAPPPDDDDDDEDEEGEDEEGDDDEGDDDEGDDDDDEGDDDDGDDADDDDDEDEPDKADPGQLLDGVPESFIGPMLKDVVMHEVGHTLGLRHNFKASTVYSLEEINSEAFKGKPITGSVMDYNPVNINFEDGELQGEYTMVTIGPYDYWAIQYGYTQEKDLKPILARVSEPELVYGTDEDTWGSDPRARRFDFGKDPLNYADSQMRLVQELRTKILERMVKDGDSWDKARDGYELLLGRHFGAVAIAGNWLGGTHINRDMKGDPGARPPVAPASVESQRRALAFVMDNTFNDEAYGLTPELLSYMRADKHLDAGGFLSIFDEPAWPVHERILGIQASVLSMLLNPSTLSRVYDNEFRIAAEEEAITLPEVIWGVSDQLWSEIDDIGSSKYTARQPMISSLRRNLQREHLERLIDLTLPDGSYGAASKPMANLSTFKLRELEAKIAKIVDRRSTRLDPYSLAHLAEARVRIEKALDASYIYNTDDISSGGGGFPFFFLKPDEER